MIGSKVNVQENTHEFYTPKSVNRNRHREAAQKSADAGKDVRWHEHEVQSPCNDGCVSVEPGDE